MPSPAQLRLFRTTAFKLSAIYLAVFSLFAAFLIGYIARHTNEILQTQLGKVLDAELGGMAEHYRRGGIERLAGLIAIRSRHPGASLYLVTDASGRKLAGNVESVPASIIAGSESEPRLVPYFRVDDEDTPTRHAALVRVMGLSDGARILVGRDVSESDELAKIVRQALILSAALMVGLGLITWIFVSRRVLKRIDSITDASRRIVEGDLSGRLEVTTTGDEFDRLAESLNTMLSRIERLMQGLKQVSDNIAHDLKTPLTRMRNRVETALAARGSEADGRAALQAAIEDADQLIRTFNALLTIARVEAGSSGAEFAPFDASEVARDVFELYEPLAEQAGVALKLEAAGPVRVNANRELVSQALANLVDNAIKYSQEAERAPEVTIRVGRQDGEAMLCVVDNGPGVPAADRGRVTERFVRLEESRSKPGAGLGLSLVSAVAQLHRGRLELGDNRPGLAAILHLPGAAPAHAA